MAGRGPAGRVFLLALALSLALQTPASADKKATTLPPFRLLDRHPCVIFFQNFPASPSALLATITTDFSILYNFSVIHGLAVQIDDSFLTSLQELPGVVKVIPGTLRQLHTTHSWDFLGLAENGQQTTAWSSAKLGADTIIGNIDTGVWPESQSFQADGSGVPLGWRGICDKGCNATFQCNDAGIQAELSLAGQQGNLPSKADLSSPRDYEGHGSHTLSTAGGSFVQGASVFGHGMGRAAGGSPWARVAAYKACYAAGCSDVDILAAVLAAVADGVHVLSLSLGAEEASDYLTDVIAIGTFFAVQSGVTVVCSAGNSGPRPGTATNVAPWIFTVGASTMDRDFPAYVNFGDRLTIEGQSLGASTLPLAQAYPIISGENANAANQPTSSSSLCLAGSLDPAKVAGKIVVCVRGVNGRVEKGLVVKQAGGVGMVLCNDASSGDSVIVDPHLVAAAHCSYSKCVQLFSYLNSTNNPSGYINATVASFGVKPAPRMASFSSRGPNAITPQILKPDITAPGVSVIAAYSGAVSPSGLPLDDRRTVAYNIMSGTSMSCPHVSGIVGLLKTKYPSWTPAMIKSAIMTTATTVANDGNPIQDETGAEATPFSYGSGHVNPVSALDPGLVYDTTLADYTNFLCSLKLTQDPLRKLPVNLPNLPVDLPVNISLPDNLLLPLFNAAGEPCMCSQGPYGRPEDLNYPSITVPCLSGSTTVRRRLKNVGKASKYKVTVTKPPGVEVTVVPNELEFGIEEGKEFTVKLDVVDAAATSNYVFGSIVWSDADGLDAYSPGVNRPAHRVRSPIVVKTNCG
ncbi:Subtilisin-like protease SBT5.3 [Dichanthelium oligosanthes]|uniref:Subtilisin-like protease SBT5.3 n=1 Tax=Dichanthelium oligosanthes TaxID=888268 RepID=A0A1E5VX19_9POAL|nr:Subtilisin-like protease SBT5.3 [Dichanthelium oligosanthes]